ncbi:MAG: cobalamin-dependent protein [Candidatus Wallbacteria bacterium]|nr:cobalamin-dependent protein [Candidatus Wallbacteria bacterium]
MKVLFIYPERGYSSSGNRTIWQGRFYYSMSVFMAFLKKHGFEVAFHQSGNPIRTLELSRILQRESPDLLAFSSLNHLSLEVKRLARKVKVLAPGLTVAWGGFFPTTDPESALNSPGVDCVCVGEGELPFLNLLSSLRDKAEITATPGFWFNSRTGAVKNRTGGLVENLDSLPFADLDASGYAGSDDYLIFKRFPLMAARGCRHSCDFCCNSALNRLYGSKTFRFRSPLHVCAELEQVTSRYPDLESIQFQNDIFFPDLEWLSRFVEQYKKIGLPVSFLLSTGSIDQESVKLLKKLPVKEVFVGVESGTLEMKERIGKQSVLTDTVKRCRMLSDAGLRVATFNMLGIPGECGADVMKSVFLNAEINPALLQLSYLYPYRGTPVYEKWWKILSTRRFYTYFEGSIFQRHFLNRHLRFYYHHFIDLVEMAAKSKNIRFLNLLFSDFLPLPLKRILLQLLKKSGQKSIFQVRF